MQIQFAKHPVLLQALYIINQLQEAGHAAYFVGGAVRDVLLERSIQDVDIATNALPEETLKLFPKAFATGLQHGTVTVVHEHINYEVTTFRVEDHYINYRKPEQVAFVKQLKLDLARRDFTMNAMAIDASGQVIDYFNGLKDLNNKVLVAVGDAEQRFKEDALRMVRAIRFATTYELTCDNKVWNAIEQCRPLLAHISMERIQQELFKLIKQKRKLSSLQLLSESKLLYYTKRSLYLSTVIEQMFNRNIDLTDVELEDELLLWTLLYAQSSLTLEQIREDFTALVFPKKLSVEIRAYIEWLRFWQLTYEALIDNEKAFSYIHLHKDYINLYRNLTNMPNQAMDNQSKIQLIAQLYWIDQATINPVYYEKFNKHFLQHCVPNKLQALVKQLYTSLQLKSITELNITGKQLSIGINAEAGPWLKQTLRLLFFAANVELVPNNKEKLLRFALQLRKNGVLG